MLGAHVKIRANNLSVVVKTFSSIQSAELSITGDATWVKSADAMALPKRSEEATRLSLCSRVAINTEEIFSTYWSKFMCSPVSKNLLEETTSRSNITSNIPQTLPASYYSVGAVWLSDQKYVAKGFSFSCSFLCDWSSVEGSILKQQFANSGDESFGNRRRESSHTSLEDNAVRSISLGSISLCLHSDRRGSQVALSHRTSDPIASLPDSVAIGLSVVGEKNLFLSFFSCLNSF